MFFYNIKRLFSNEILYNQLFKSNNTKSNKTMVILHGILGNQKNWKGYARQYIYYI